MKPVILSLALCVAMNAQQLPQGKAHCVMYNGWLMYWAGSGAVMPDFYPVQCPAQPAPKPKHEHVAKAQKVHCTDGFCVNFGDGRLLWTYPAHNPIPTTPDSFPTALAAIQAVKKDSYD